MLRPEWVHDDSEIEDTFGDGERAILWLRSLKHPKNPAHGHPFELDRWAERIVRRIYGPRHPDGSRIVKKVYIVVPRGSRKSSLSAALGLLHVAGPELVVGGLVVSAARNHQQAKIIFEEAASIVSFDRRGLGGLKTTDTKSTIRYPKRRSKYVALSADGKAHHGATPSVVLIDEIVHWDGIAGTEQWLSLNSALRKVENTLLIITTTAGAGEDHIAWPEIKYAMDVQKGIVDDPSVLPVIYLTEDGDDWESEEHWHKVCPGMEHGYPVLATYRIDAQKAKHSLTARAEFLQFGLNKWMAESVSGFVEMPIYDRGSGRVDLRLLEDEPCWLGVDLSQNQDLTAVVGAWSDGRGGYFVYPWFFCPRDNLHSLGAKSEQPYEEWASDGLLIPTPGNVVDFEYVEDHIRDLCRKFDVRQIAFDPFLARRSLINLGEEGLPVVEFRQGFQTMAPAISTLERVIVSEKLIHGGHPILRWNVSNAVVEFDHANNKKFTKKKAKKKIDGLVAMTMAVACAADGEDARSIYDDVSARPEGLLVF